MPKRGGEGACSTYFEHAGAAVDEGRHRSCRGGSARNPRLHLRMRRCSGMVSGMATRKVTITLDEVQLAQIRSLVQAHAAPSVSGFVQHAVAVALDDVAGWGAMLAKALRETGGALSDQERAWADDLLGTGSQPAA
jgi:Arc/MetJ-type ribon-helix-helix transcriptional regulator